jgi:hypothetical protein
MAAIGSAVSQALYGFTGAWTLPGAIAPAFNRDIGDSVDSGGRLVRNDTNDERRAEHSGRG